jgi:hypothetical protein
MYIIYNISRNLFVSVECGPGRGQNEVLGDFDTYISKHMLLPPEDCFLHKQHLENSERIIWIFSYENLFI